MMKPMNIFLVPFPQIAKGRFDNFENDGPRDVFSATATGMLHLNLA